MRFFLPLVAVMALISIARTEPKPLKMSGTPFQLPGPFVDGTIITFFVWHQGKPFANAETVVIDFYNYPANYSWKTGGVYDIPAQIAILPPNTVDYIRPVITNTKQHGLWRVEGVGQRLYQRLDDNLERFGWWRIDVVKIDSKRLNIFLQGFWAGIRDFGMSLDDIQSAFIDSTFIDTRFFEITVKTGNPKLSPEWFNGMGGHEAVPNPLAKINTFPIGSRIEMIAMLRATGNQDSKFPTLYFGPKSVKEVDTIFVGISQWWDENMQSNKLGIHSNDPDYSTKGLGAGFRSTECINTKPNGDLHHLQIERISKDVIRMRVMYHVISDNMGEVTCDLTIPPSLWSHMDRPFYILSDQGAVLFHIEQSIPQALLPLL